MADVNQKNTVYFLGRTVPRKKLTTSDVLHLQRLLKAEGIYQGALDGMLGDGCEQATQQFKTESDRLVDQLGRFDRRTERNIRSLRLVTQREARLFMKRLQASPLASSGLAVKIICGTRTYPEQSALYAKGRTRPGRKVTKKDAGQSYHNFGLAWDIGIFSRSGKYLTDKKYYQAVGQAGQDNTLVWGGNSLFFLFFRDMPHYQLAEATSFRGTSQLRADFEQGQACFLPNNARQASTA